MINACINVVIPVYNGAMTIERLVKRLIPVLKIFENRRIILVDDCSTDSSFSIIKALALKHAVVTGIELAHNYGQQNAVLCGLNFTGSGYTVIIDDDLENNPEDIILLYEKITEGFDVVYGIDRNEKKKGIIRKTGSWVRDITFNILTGKPKKIKLCSFRIINEKTVDEVKKAKGKFVYISMEILKSTVNIGNVEVRYGKRGRSGHSTKKLISLLLNIYIYYSHSRLLERLRKPGPPYVVSKITEEETI